MYGNWGGGNYSGGKWQGSIPSNPAAPTDAYGACYMQHDYCYAAVNPEPPKSGSSQSCSTTQKTSDCDTALSMCLEKARDAYQAYKLYLSCRAGDTLQ
jgi:hypothetical protein